MSRSNVVSLERDLAGPDSASTTSEPWKCARACRSRPWRVPKRCARTSGSACWSDADRAQAHRREPLRGLGPDPRDDPQRRARQPPARLLAAHGDEPLRLLEVRGDLGDQPVRPDADGQADPRPVAHLRDELAQHAQRLLGVGHVGVALVEPDLRDDGEPLADQRPHLARLLAVGGEVGREEDGLRAQPPRLGGRRGRADAELPGLVGRGRHHRPRAAAGDHDRLADQVRPAQQLDRHVERVAVEMGDDAAVGHSPIVSDDMDVVFAVDRRPDDRRSNDRRTPTTTRPRPARAPRGSAAAAALASSSAPRISTSGLRGTS